jgi:tRNA dimethylallyltransferase
MPSGPEGPSCWVLLGPTAVGKTELSLRLAQRHPVEIVSVDSMQVYRGMDIGTAKPGPEQLAQVPHHMIDVVGPEESFSVGRYCAMAMEAIAGIQARGKRPLLVCGTPLYLKGLLWGLFEGPGADLALRRRLRREAAEAGVPALHGRLAAVDPASAERIDPNDLRRVERALEVHELTGKPISSLQDQFRAAPRLPHVIVGLNRPRAQLYERIDRRVDQMMAAGLPAEVRGLLGRLGLQAGQAVGYKEMAAHLRGELSLEEAVALIKRNSRRFAKHQLTWMRHFPGTVWLELASGVPMTEALRPCELLLMSLDRASGFGYD